MNLHNYNRDLIISLLAMIWLIWEFFKRCSDWLILKLLNIKC